MGPSKIVYGYHILLVLHDPTSTNAAQVSIRLHLQKLRGSIRPPLSCAL